MFNMFITYYIYNCHLYKLKYLNFISVFFIVSSHDQTLNLCVCCKTSVWPHEGAVLHNYPLTFKTFCLLTNDKDTRVYSIKKELYVMDLNVVFFKNLTLKSSVGKSSLNLDHQDKSVSLNDCYFSSSEWDKMEVRG